MALGSKASYQRWMGVLRTPLGATAAAVMTAVLVLAVLAPILWSDRAEQPNTDQILAGPSATIGSVPTASVVTCSSGCSSPPGSPSSWPCWRR